MELERMKANLIEAQAAGDEDLIDELESKGPALQKLVHKQGFSTWPIDELLKKIESNMPEIADRAEVDVIVSKWDIAYQRSETVLVDITNLMVAPFDPDEQTLKIIADIQTKDPVPVESITNE